MKARLETPATLAACPRVALPVSYSFVANNNRASSVENPQEGPR
jgi:hypothetical protein